MHVACETYRGSQVQVLFLPVLQPFSAVCSSRNARYFWLLCFCTACGPAKNVLCCLGLLSPSRFTSCFACLWQARWWMLSIRVPQGTSVMKLYLCTYYIGRDFPACSHDWNKTIFCEHRLTKSTKIRHSLATTTPGFHWGLVSWHARISLGNTYFWVKSRNSWAHDVQLRIYYTPKSSLMWVTGGPQGLPEWGSGSDKQFFSSWIKREERNIGDYLAFLTWVRKVFVYLTGKPASFTKFLGEISKYFWED